MALQVVVEYHIYVAVYVCELLPHFFTLTTVVCTFVQTACTFVQTVCTFVQAVCTFVRLSVAVIFCYPVHKFSPICAFRSTMPFLVRTFLPVMLVAQRPER